MADHNTLGKLGEGLAVDFLLQKGYAILGEELAVSEGRGGHYRI